MARYRSDDGIVVETNNATSRWDEDTYFDGSNRISRATGSQWNHQTLYRSRKGRYYLIHTSQWQGSRDRCEWISHQEATRWLYENEQEIPDELSEYVDQVSE
jgi:hypothetical protein